MLPITDENFMRMFFLFLLILPSFLWAQDRTTAVPLQTIQEVDPTSKAEEMVKLHKARIAIVDYDLLRQDFPALQSLSNPQIDDWLLSQVAYISRPQVNQKVVNSPIPTNGETRSAWRPEGYGRAIVFDMKDTDGNHIGLIDAKGTGALNPGQRDHGNGLATLGEAIREYNYENAVRGVLVDSGLPNRTVGSYGVIDAGFDVVHADGSKSRAGIYLRQSHSRPVWHGLLSRQQRDVLDSTFHKYGIYTGPLHNDNIQGTKTGDIYDFGHYVVKDDLPGLDPAKALPFEIWGYDKSIQATGSDTRWFYSKVDKPWIWGHETAEAFAEGRATRDDIWRHHVEMVKPPLKKLSCPTGFQHILHSLFAD